MVGAFIRRTLPRVLVGLGSAALVARALRLNGRKTYPDPQDLIIEPEETVRVRRGIGGVIIDWQVEADSVTIYSGTSPDAIDYKSPLITVEGRQDAVLKDIPLRPRPYFGIAFTGGPMDGKCLIAAERILPLEGAFNFRDAGGYLTKEGRQVRWGMVYRSGGLSRLTDADHAYLQDLGITVVCDLRSDDEVESMPDLLPESMIYIRHTLSPENNPLGDRQRIFRSLNKLDEVMLEAYTLNMVDVNARVFGNTLRLIAENMPIVYHCTAGKDRTGLTSAFLLHILGVPEETIIADYSLSSHTTELLYQSFYENSPRTPLRPILMPRLRPLMASDPATLRATLAYVRTRYGSLTGWLREHAGVDDALMHRLRDLLLVG